MGPVPAEFSDLFERRVYATLATMRPNGTPHLTIVWIDADEKHILVNTARDRAKVTHVRKNPTVGLLALDPDDPFRYVSVHGEVEEITEDGAIEHYNALGRRYTGVENRYAERHADDDSVRVVLKIRPDGVICH